jgi:hypothetical protein
MSFSPKSLAILKLGSVSFVTALALAAILSFQVVRADGSGDPTASSTPPDATSTPPTATTTPIFTLTIGTTTPDASSTAPDTSGTTSTTTATTTPDSNPTASTSPSSFGTAHLLVRDGSVIAWSGSITFPIGTSTTAIAPTNSSSTVHVLDQSLLGAVLHLEQSETAFTISDLAYYSSFGEFLINCITVPVAGTAPACYNWQYQVNGTYPFVGIDQYQLHDGDTVNLYFGSPRQVTLATSTVATGQSFVATAQSYDAQTNTYGAVTGYTIGITQPDPSNPWSPKEIATSTVNTNGQATFVLTTAGAYGAGLQEDFYSNLTPLTVFSAATTTATNTPSGPTSTGGGSGGGSGSGQQTSAGNIPSAFMYLVNHQNGDGSFITPFITDWSALAFALSDAPQAARQKLSGYLSSVPVSLSSPTDYERHAMALMALGINPYTGSTADDITPIVQAFDGTKIGDASLINNDIFGLIVLPHAGYTTSDSVIQKTTAYTISQQGANGSWSSSVDLTAAGIQALSPLSSLPGVAGALTKAESYLRTQQQADAGFGNSFSTSWVLGAIAARGESPVEWSVGTSTPRTALAALQQSDGSIDLATEDTNSRTWATAYALTALENRSWSSLLGNFTKPVVTTGTGNGLGVTAATTTSATSSTTPVLASTTPPLFAPVVPASSPTTTVHNPINKNQHSLIATKIRSHKPTPRSALNTLASSTDFAKTSLASAGEAPAAHSFWQSFIGMIASIGSLFGHWF